MASRSEQKKLKFSLIHPINKQPVRFNMAFSKTAVLPGKDVIPEFFVEGLLSGKRVDDVTKFFDLQSALDRKFQVLLELIGRYYYRVTGVI